MDYIWHITVIAAIYGILAISLDLLVGWTGLLSLAHAAFWGLGAYIAALLLIHANFSTELALVAAVMGTGLFALLVGLPFLRLKGDHFALGTFALQVVLFSVFNNWIDVTRGPMGIPGVPRPVVLGWRIDSVSEFAAIAALFAGAAYFLVWRVVKSPFGRVLEGIREDEVFVASLGKNVFSFKAAAFAISASLAGLAGALFAQYLTYINPSSFTIMESVLILSMVIIGGAGSLAGPIIGAALLVTLPELLRFMGLPAEIAGHLRHLLYGSLLVILVIFRPQGIAGRYAFGQEAA